MKEWMFPTSYNYLQAEASHLIHHADSNQVQFYIHYLKLFKLIRCPVFISELTQQEGRGKKMANLV